MRTGKLAVWVVALCLLCSCQPNIVSTPQPGNSSSTVSEQSSQAASSEAPEEPEIPEIKVGDTIEAEEICEFTVNHVTFTYDVLPDHMDVIYNHYEAEKGKIYLDIDVSIKNLSKNNLPCDEVAEITLDYNDGYTYQAFPVVEDSQTGFTYANISSIDPLETVEMRYLVDCPIEVYVNENSADIFMTIAVGGEERILTVYKDGKITEKSMLNIAQFTDEQIDAIRAVLSEYGIEPTWYENGPKINIEDTKAQEIFDNTHCIQSYIHTTDQQTYLLIFSLDYNLVVTIGRQPEGTFLYQDVESLLNRYYASQQTTAYAEPQQQQEKPKLYEEDIVYYVDLSKQRTVENVDMSPRKD